MRGTQNLAALLLSLAATAGFARGGSEPLCTNAARQQPEIVAARTALQRTPSALLKRISLADLLLKTECFDDAVHVLEEGEKFNPHNAYLENRLSRARSMLRQEQYFEGINEAEATARIARKTLHCTRLGDIAACDDVLKQQPRNIEIVLAKADALVKQHRSIDALAAYERAAQLAPGNPTISAKVEALKSERLAVLKRCTDGNGDTALQACMASLIKGAPNEFDITLRIAMLQQSTNQPAQALDSYIAANSLRHGNKEVALAILALLDSTRRKDGVALAARGSSLVTLGRASEAIASFRQAYALAPDLPEISKQLSAAETLARAESPARKEAQPRATPAVASAEAVAEAVPAPPSYSNAAAATRSN
jgi:tetratricopeptide (TPR) repeat protein